jgi:DNA-binding CsgD family transcriptional regulator
MERDVDEEQEAEIEGTVRLTTSLHVDLVWTDLADFAEHFERALQNQPQALLGDTEGRRVIVESSAEGDTHIGYYGGNEDDPPAFLLVANRYRRDRLKIVVFESWTPTEPAMYAPRLRLWIEKRWGKKDDGYFDLDLGDAPEPDRANSPLLTEAETVIAEMLAKGMSDEAISRARVSSPKTVETQRKSIAKKLEIPADKDTIAESLKPFGFGSV